MTTAKFCSELGTKGASLVTQMVKNLPAMREPWVRSLGWEYPLEEGMTTHSSILAWRNPHGQRSMVGCRPWVAKSQTQLSDYAHTHRHTDTHTHTHTHTHGGKGEKVQLYLEISSLQRAAGLLVILSGTAPFLVNFTPENRLGHPYGPPVSASHFKGW